MAKTLVLGLGVSGRGAAELLLSKGKSVVGVEENLQLLMTDPQIWRLRAMGMEVGKESLDLIDQVILSPGIAQTHPVLLKAKERGIEVIGEAELAFRHLKQRAVGITGTNGKTTVTLMVAHVLQSAGIAAEALGNVGTSLASYALRAKEDEVIVAELSSYQLETMRGEIFDVAAILNITPDHLDRYQSMEDYATAKCRIQDCMKQGGVLWIDKQTAREYVHLLKREYQIFATGETVESLLPIGYRGWGIHESLNALAAWSLCAPFGVDRPTFIKGLETFARPHHRIEFVAEVANVSYFDDSKGTNLDAVIKAVEAMKGSVVLIAGGVDKGASYTRWLAPFKGKVKQIFALGQSAQKIKEEIGVAFQVEIVKNMDEAVEKAAAFAAPGDNVLLSPGCSSFDQFRDYVHRGKEFQRCVQAIGRRNLL